MLPFKAGEKTNHVSRLAFKSNFSGRRLSGQRPALHLLPLLLILIVLAACDADNPVIAPEICDAYEDALFTVQIIGGAAVVVGLALLAFKKTLASIFPSQGSDRRHCHDGGHGCLSAHLLHRVGHNPAVHFRPAGYVHALWAGVNDLIVPPGWSETRTCGHRTIQEEAAGMIC